MGALVVGAFLMFLSNSPEDHSIPSSEELPWKNEVSEHLPSRPESLEDESAKIGKAGILATVTIDGKTVYLTPFSDGSFERQDIQPNASVSVQLTFNELPVGAPVQVMTADGGFINGSLQSNAWKLDESKQIAFNFSATSNPGLNRIVIHSPDSRKFLHFWVGEKLLPPIKR